MNPIHHLAQRLADAHSGLQIGAPLRLHEALQAGDAALPPVEAAARIAARMLGFVEADAEAVARAWQRRAERTKTAHVLLQGSRASTAQAAPSAAGAHDPGNALAWPDEPVDFGLGPWPRSGAFADGPLALGLYVVAPDADWVARLAQWGVPTLQLRFKSADAKAVAQQVRQAVRAVAGTASRLFINDHWQAALESGAYGVHLGQEDLDMLGPEALETVRRSGMRLGLSTHGYAEMLRADALAPSYLALGAVYPTTLKEMSTAPQGPGRLRQYARLMRQRPVVAIGGIDESRVDEVMAAGVGSLAVVRAVIGAADPQAAARRLMERVQAFQRSP